MRLPQNSLYKIIYEWFSLNGDHTFWGWLITILYLFTVAGSFYYVKTINNTKISKEKRILWLFIGSFLTFMGINKQLDIQLLLTISGRYIGLKFSFLGMRRIFQSYFTAAIFLSVLFITGIVIYKIRTILKESLIELIGITFIIGFFFIQTASMTHFKWIIRFDEVNIPHIHGLELLGVMILLLALFYNIHKQKAD